MTQPIIETAMFGVLAVLMLLGSCFNYITISLGSSARRLGEIGIRKSSGAIKKQLIALLAVPKAPEGRAGRGSSK